MLPFGRYFFNFFRHRFLLRFGRQRTAKAVVNRRIGAALCALSPRLTRISVWKSSRGGVFSLRVSVRVCVLRAYRYLYGSSPFLTRCPRWVRPPSLLFSDTTRQCWIASGKPPSISSNRNLGGVHRLRRVDKLFYVYRGKWNESHV